MSMTRKEAASILQSMFDKSCGNYRFQNAEKLDKEDALWVAIKALHTPTREQVERMRGEWIMKHRHHGGFRRVTGMDDMGEQHTITIDERCEYNDRYCSRCGKQSPDNFLNFCGYCGEPKTDEAVDMMLQRWKEAMNDEA